MTDRDYMNRAIELAKKGLGWTNPNPLVGAVIVKEGRIIGEGYHRRYGELHAERNAIASLAESAKGATIYVTLEPCCHYGKTPPCTEAILENGIARVVIGSRDPNPKVAGKGARILREAGILVEEDFMREECDVLNPVFFHYITTGMPYVVMKYAMTADGKTATRTGASKWITGEESRLEVQRLRSRFMGIMAGIGTVLADDPMLNVRIPGGRSPVRIICDSSLRIPLDSRICQTSKDYPTIIACALDAPKADNAEEKERTGEIPGEKEQTGEIPGEKEQTGEIPGEKERTGEIPEEKAAKVRELEDLGMQVLMVSDGNGQVDLKKLMQILGSQKIDSILLEGGGALNDSALRQGIVQEIQVFIAPKIFGGQNARTPVAGIGVEVPGEAVPLKLREISQIDGDLLIKYRVE